MIYTHTKPALSKIVEEAGSRLSLPLGTLCFLSEYPAGAHALCLLGSLLCQLPPTTPLPTPTSSDRSHVTSAFLSKLSWLYWPRA